MINLQLISGIPSNLLCESSSFGTGVILGCSPLFLLKLRGVSITLKPSITLFPSRIIDSKESMIFGINKLNKTLEGKAKVLLSLNLFSQIKISKCWMSPWFSMYFHLNTHSL